ncbi:MAG: Rpn family recombination-promoting nuclease/putative transposase, partial [Saprospiraceae bacterium]
YERFLVNLHREKDMLGTAKEEGIKKGKKQNALEIATQMKKDKMPINLIIKYTGLAKEEIEAIIIE